MAIELEWGISLKTNEGQPKFLRGRLRLFILCSYSTHYDLLIEISFGISHGSYQIT